MSRVSRSASRVASRASAFASFLLLALVAACDSRPRAGADTGAATAAAAAPSSDKYVPEGDEGLGASVAILLDNSGSMRDHAGGDPAPKYIVARGAIESMLAATDSFVARQPGFPIKVGLYEFDSEVTRLVDIAAYDRAKITAALETMRGPDGGTAIGRAMRAAREDLYRAGTIRKYILVVTDGENTSGPAPDRVALEIARRSEGAVRMYFVAFDIDARKFAFLPSVGGEVLGASNSVALKASLDTIYRGRILAEAVDAGETLPGAKADSASRSRAGDSTGSSSRPRTPRP
jgi:Mg-chelatase subunit ChlD